MGVETSIFLLILHLLVVCSAGLALWIKWEQEFQTTKLESIERRLIDIDDHLGKIEKRMTIMRFELERLNPSDIFKEFPD